MGDTKSHKKVFKFLNRDRKSFNVWKSRVKSDKVDMNVSVIMLDFSLYKFREKYG